ncbi:MAG: HAMP domain-containing histidine kinase [Gemmataceae bacterium]|nr:HAMP domain-containing histidine kinase [Gemmataceae bacterium]
MRSLWQTVRALLPPLILAALVVLVLREPVAWWLHGQEIYDQEAIKEWIREARNVKTLPELVKEYLDLHGRERLLAEQAAAADEDERRRLERLQDAAHEEMAGKREEIGEFLKSIGNPPTKIYTGQLPLFPIIYQLRVTFAEELQAAPIVWDSQLPRQRSQYRELESEPIHASASVGVQYHLHAYQKRQTQERQEATRRLWLSGLGIMFALLAIAWVVLAQRRERRRDRQRLLTEQHLGEVERLRLEEELRRQEAERKHQEAQRQNLELKSQLFANIGIMAGSYAHNIKNLLVRPNDLLRRCLEEEVAERDQAHMLREVKHTLGTVTERLQQILSTVRRDPSKSERTRIDLNVLLRDMHAAWSELAREKWKLTLELDTSSQPLWIEGDLSHLQQAFENLLFNARDSTFEMRGRLRDQARGKTSEVAKTAGASPLPDSKRQALIDAAAWKGQVTLRSRLAGDRAVIEVADNGIGMTDDVRRRCIETHFSTKRDNALFAGLTAGMGLGLSFVQVILQHHGAVLEIDSAPLQGATFRVSFPLASS